MESKIYVDPKGVLKYVKEMPEEPLLYKETASVFADKNLIKKLWYTEALQKAKDESIEFQDQEKVGRAIVLSGTYSKSQIDKFYPIPSGYKVEVINYCPACNAVQMRNCAHFDKCGNTKTVAILSPQESKEDEQEESQDKLWEQLAQIAIKCIIHTGPSAGFDSVSFEDEAKVRGFRLSRKTS
jgi:hypothetical protein